MRRRVALSRDTLQAHRLPPTEYMELNYRPAIGAGVGGAASVLALPLFWQPPFLDFCGSSAGSGLF